jgi:hypothetical protein
MKTIADEWQEFSAMTQPSNAGAVQRTETRRAFYGGAWAMLTMLTRATDQLSEDDVVKYLSQLERESRAFNDDVQAGKA